MRRQYPIRLAQRSSRPARHSGPIFRRSVVPHLLMRRMPEMGHSDLSQDAWLRWFDTSARVTT